MQYRKFGNTELTVSEIGFGAWAIGGNAKVGDTPMDGEKLMMRHRRRQFMQP